MRRIGIVIALALTALGLAGHGTPAAAQTPISSPMGCWNNGGYNFGCSAVVSGGTGVYSYDWTVSVRPALSSQTSTYHVVTYDPYLSGWCSAGDRITVTLTVTDSAGATKTTSGRSLTCSQWAD
jgi:hypothetical protein